eukprot:COSAG01_NODE_35462_length_531_cov_1.180556_1_plen_96_part_01
MHLRFPDDDESSVGGGGAAAADDDSRSWPAAWTTAVGTGKAALKSGTAAISDADYRAALSWAATEGFPLMLLCSVLLVVALIISPQQLFVVQVRRI